MSSSSEENGATTQKKFKGVRQRKWGKWVSEIRVPGTQDRLWLGTYATPEAAAVARDVALYCLHRPSTLDNLNFPLMLPSAVHRQDISPRSVQKAASDAGMAIDAQLIVNKLPENDVKVEESGVVHGSETSRFWEDQYSAGIWDLGSHDQFKEGEALSISIEDYL